MENLDNYYSKTLKYLLISKHKPYNNFCISKLKQVHVNLYYKKKEKFSLILIFWVMYLLMGKRPVFYKSKKKSQYLKFGRKNYQLIGCRVSFSGDKGLTFLLKFYKNLFSSFEFSSLLVFFFKKNIQIEMRGHFNSIEVYHLFQYFQSAPNFISFFLDFIFNKKNQGQSKTFLRAHQIPV